MTWEAVTLIVYFALNAVGSVALIGRPRQAMSPGDAVIMLVAYSLLIWLVVRLALS